MPRLEALTQHCGACQASSYHTQAVVLDHWRAVEGAHERFNKILQTFVAMILRTSCRCSGVP